MVSNVTGALSAYETYKTGFSIIILVLCLCCAIGAAIYNYQQHYVSTKNCNIQLNNSDQSVTLSYVVNDKTYTYNLPPVVTTTNNVNQIRPVHNPGSCTVYYKSSDPGSYNLDVNPTFIFEVISGILCCFVIFTIIWFMFLRANPGVAAVAGGLDVGQQVVNSFMRE